MVECVSSKPVLAVFDFDGTLTFRDSFTLFLRVELGLTSYFKGMTGLLILALRFLAGLKTRDQLKADLIRAFLTGISVAKLEKLADDFCNRYWERLMRLNGYAEVKKQLAAGATVTLCSASPEIILRPFAQRLGVLLIATQLEEHSGVLTGNISVQNCRQQEKITRLEAIYGDLAKFHLRAWGDSDGDKQLLEAADEPYYRHFH